MLNVDAIDMSGKHEVDIDTNIWKAGRFTYFIYTLTCCVTLSAKGMCM